jgi:hypothetical protein
MSNSKDYTIVKQQTIPKEELISITFSRPLTVMCTTKLDITDQKLFLSNFENNLFDNKVLEKLISDNLVSNYGEIKGTKIKDRYIDPKSWEIKKTPGIHV